MGRFFALLGTGGAPITISNAFSILSSGAGFNFAADPNTPVTSAGNWSLGANSVNVRNNGISTSPLTLSGVISGSGGIAISANNAGTIIFSGTNTYTGITTVNSGTLEVSGSIAGSVVTNFAGTLKLDSTTALSRNTSLSVLSSGANSVNLNFTGTNTIFALFIDGTAQASGTWGAVGSTAQNQNAIFTGSGLLNVPGTPVILQQPQSQAAYPDGTVTFSVAVSGGAPFTYQWKFNGGNIAGATDSSYTISPVETNNAGTYSVAITNLVGFTNSAGATLTVLGTNGYVNTIRADNPISYWRLDETNGVLARDGIGNRVGIYTNVALNQVGFSQTDPDPAIGVPTVAAPGRGFVQVTNFAPFIFPAGSPTFTLEAWAYSTNFNTKGRLFSTLNLGSPGGYAFGILPGGTGLEFTAGGIRDTDLALTNALLAGLWYHLVCTCDGNSYTFYVNGQNVGAIAVSGGANPGAAVPLVMGANPPAYTFAGGDNGAEQLHGRLDEAAIYGSALSDAQILAHYNARYGSLTPPAVSTPIANPPTNYQSLSATIQAVAGGQALSYQWFKGATSIPGQTSDTLTLSLLQLSDSGNYSVQVSNPAGTTNSPPVTLTVLAIPTNSTQLNLTNALVLHLPFDGDYQDISGHSNNGTNVGSTTFTNGVIGTNALHYSSDTSSSNFNYVTLGIRPDLQFGASTDFTVSYWVRQPPGSTYTNLPFFTDAIGSTGNGGFAFAPYQTATSAGGWSLTIGSMSSPSQFTSFPDSNLINDGNWHHLVHVANRSASVTTYLDGALVDSEADSFVGNIDTVNAATIGQDPTGAYPVTAQADLDDLAVWQRTLTRLEVSGIYLAGATNGVSFAPPLASAPVQVALQIQKVGGQYQLTWSGTAGALQASGNVTGTYTNVPGAASPYTVPTSSGPQLYYRLKY